MKFDDSNGPFKANHSFHVSKTKAMGGILKPAFGSKLNA
jgi:hypothetical protein